MQPMKPSAIFTLKACNTAKISGAKRWRRFTHDPFDGAQDHGERSRTMTTTAAEGRVVLDAKGVTQKVQALALAIAKEFSDRQQNLALVGVQTRGVILARRIAAQLKEKWGREIPV